MSEISGLVLQDNLSPSESQLCWVQKWPSLQLPLFLGDAPTVFFCFYR